MCEWWRGEGRWWRGEGQVVERGGAGGGEGRGGAGDQTRLMGSLFKLSVFLLHLIVGQACQSQVNMQLE